ncbi:hypothetical protein [Thiohalorhabdus methylotrophus]|uniref:Uncharacterized protein n=1 Tax=Thiohalorhabdus methylotrophus TaxID=3242694 RepID=A0ABV4TTQ0_9GAMM
MRARNRMPRFAYLGSIGVALVSAIAVPFWMSRRSRRGERGYLLRRKGHYFNRKGHLRRGHLFH